jgi:hypothetical protein
MNTMKHLIILFLFPVFSCFSQSGQKTMVWKEGANSPAADLQVIDWLTGHWRGEAMGGVTEEIWSPTIAGSKMFSFKMAIKEEVIFYEFGAMSQENGTLILRLKHFNADLKGWEEKNEREEFRLIKVTPEKVFFDGFTFEKISENEINMYVLMEHKDKPSEELKFNYKRYVSK